MSSVLFKDLSSSKISRRTIDRDRIELNPTSDKIGSTSVNRSVGEEAMNLTMLPERAFFVEKCVIAGPEVDEKEEKTDGGAVLEIRPEGLG